VDLVTALRTADLEPKEITFVHSNENSAAKLMLVKAMKGAKPEVTIQKPLYIYNLEGGYTDEASEILENGKDNNY
jgi:tRNA1Val (adenine37-N6)-methyltransferase